MGRVVVGVGNGGRFRVEGGGVRSDSKEKSSSESESADTDGLEGSGMSGGGGFGCRGRVWLRVLAMYTCGA